jgi:hypothetical protein
MGRTQNRSLARLAALCASCTTLLVSAHLPARASASPSTQQREHIEPASAPAPGWLRRALRHRAGGLPPASPTDDPHAGELTVELVVGEAQQGAPRVDLSQLVVEVLFVAREPSAPSWTAVARAGPEGRATFARVPEGRPHVLVLAPESERVPLVPDPARYGFLFEPFGSGPFPHLALDEVPLEGGARTVRLQLVPGRAAHGLVELFGTLPPATGLRPGEVTVEHALVWVASPGWVQIVPIGADGAFQWFDPRPAPAAPFDPAAPSAGFLERLTGGVARPYGSAGSDWRDCSGVPAPPIGHPFVIELTLESSVRRASGAEAFDPLPPRASKSPTEESPTAAAAALERWRVLRATPLTEDGLTTTALTRAERRTLASALLERPPPTGGPPRDDVAWYLPLACRWELDPTHSDSQSWLSMFAPQHELFMLAREWLASATSTPEQAEEAELALLDRARGPAQAVLESPYLQQFAAQVPLQLWIDVVAPRYPGYAEALAAFNADLRAPRRPMARGALPEGLAELDANDLLAALRKRPSSTLGTELAPLVGTAPRAAAERLLIAFATLARDGARGPAVRVGAIDLLLALGARSTQDGPELAEIVLAALGDEPSDVELTEATLAALVPLAPERALRIARKALDAFARDEAMPNLADSRPLPPQGALLVLGALAPHELVRRAEELPSYVPYAAAALLLEGQDALDARGLPHAFLERLLR